MQERLSLRRFAWLSIVAAVATISLKTVAYLLTGSVGLLSDALESLVNLVTAVLALWMLTIAARPPDEDHAYGHDKAEYFSSGIEGTLILVAAVSIIASAVPRLLAPQPLEQVGLGLTLSVIASAINAGVAWVLLQAGRRYRSITLEADAHHLLTDVWTSAGVLIGIGAVAFTGWQILDPIIALFVAINIVWAGVKLLRRSVQGLMDTAITAEHRQSVQRVLTQYEAEGVHHHALRTRQSGGRNFVEFHVLVPGWWSVKQGHTMLEHMESDIRKAVPQVTVFTHLEPDNDPASWQDVELDRESEPAPERTTTNS
jgi:cation diffusion facilitator family transporter